MKQLQREEEMAWFAALLAREGVRSYLEIGSKFGGSLERVALALPRGSRIVSVDLPTEKSGSEAALKTCATALWPDYDVRLFRGDSTAPEIIASAAALGPYDAVFIDANHTLPYVTKDWENYGPMARIVAFHDIAFVQKPEGRYKGIEVPQFWESIKAGYRHEECKLDGPHNGIGVLWRS
jgi:predicted O-methyltransferase YrrM